MMLNGTVIQRKIFHIVAALVLGCRLIFGQETHTGSILVTVLDLDTRQPVIGANVQLAGTTIGGSANEQGKCRLNAVPVGNHSVRVSAVGYRRAVRTDIIVNSVKPAEVVIPINQEAVTLDEVNVVAGYFREHPDAPVSTHDQSPEELRRLPGGFEDVVRAVSILPGVAQVQAGRNDLVVRGGAPSENLFLVDNIEIPNINHFGTQGASGGPLSYINLDLVDGTSFSSGGFGVRYGDKLSSILSIELRDGRMDTFGGKAVISATQFGFVGEGPLGNRGSVIFSARRSYLDFIFKAAGLSFVPEYWDFMTKGTCSLGPSDKVSFLGIGVLDNVRPFDDNRDKIFDNSHILLNDQKQWIGGMTLQHLFHDGMASISLAETINRYDFMQHDTLLRPIFSNYADENTTALRGDVVFQFGAEGEISFGVQTKYAAMYDAMYLVPFWTNYGQQLSVNASVNACSWKQAAYFQYIRSLGSVRLTGGIRVDGNSLLEHSWKLSPRFSMTVLLMPRLTTAVSMGVYHQGPSMVWMVSNPQNRSLSSITANQYVASAEYLLRDDFKIGLEGYEKYYRDYPASSMQPFVTLSNFGAGYGGSRDGFEEFGIDPMVSQGWGRARGVELFFQKKLATSPFYGLGSFTLASVDFAGLDGVLRPGSFDQRWIINLGGGCIVDERWEFSAKFRYATGRPYTPYNPDGTQTAFLYNSARVGINHSLDARVDRRWMLDRAAVVAFIDIENIYNRKAVDVPVYNERKGVVEQVNTIGILPSIGISVEF